MLVQCVARAKAYKKLERAWLCIQHSTMLNQGE